MKIFFINFCNLFHSHDTFAVDNGHMKFLFQIFIDGMSGNLGSKAGNGFLQKIIMVDDQRDIFKIMDTLNIIYFCTSGKSCVSWLQSSRLAGRYCGHLFPAWSVHSRHWQEDWPHVAGYCGSSRKSGSECFRKAESPDRQRCCPLFSFSDLYRYLRKYFWAFQFSIHVRSKIYSRIYDFWNNYKRFSR